MIYHIAYSADWNGAQEGGEYRVSTGGRTLEEVGFIHCGNRDQVEAVANAVYRGERDLVVLVIDPCQVQAEIKREDPDGSGTRFPHIYGPLPTTAVVDVIPFAPGPDGLFSFPP